MAQVTMKGLVLGYGERKNKEGKVYRALRLDVDGKDPLTMQLNIPEETAWYLRRKTGGWENMTLVLAIGHFIVPFLFLLPRTVKRKPLLLVLAALWILAMHACDLIWLVRPEVYAAHGGHPAPAAPGPSSWWLDVAAIVGVFGVFFSFLVRRIASGPLMPLRDPRMPEALAHKNYV